VYRWLAIRRRRRRYATCMRQRQRQALSSWQPAVCLLCRAPAMQQCQAQPASQLLSQREGRHTAHSTQLGAMPVGSRRLVYTDGGADGNGANGQHGACGFGVVVTEKQADWTPGNLTRPRSSGRDKQTQSAVHTRSVDQPSPCNLQGLDRSPAKIACRNFLAAASDCRRLGV
jgi:hypothetical protein